MELMNCNHEDVVHQFTLADGSKVWASFTVEFDRDEDSGRIIRSVDGDRISCDADLGYDELMELHDLINEYAQLF
jgi:hypothetical protein